MALVGAFRWAKGRGKRVELLAALSLHGPGPAEVSQISEIFKLSPD